MRQQRPAPSAQSLLRLRRIVPAGAALPAVIALAGCSLVNPTAHPWRSFGR